MLVGVVLIPTGALDTARSRLRGLLLPGQRRIHTSNESSRRRRALLDTLARIENLTGVVLAFRRPPGTDRVAGRRRLLTAATEQVVQDRKSTRLNSSHSQISYAVFCLKKK